MYGPFPKSSRVVAKQIGQFAKEYSGKSLTEFYTKLESLEQQLLTQVSTSWATEVRRRCAELFATECLARRSDWKRTQRALARLDELGYSNVERRGHFAILLGHYARDFPQAADEAYTRVEDTLRRVRCLRKTSVLRIDYESKLERILAN